MRTLVLKSKYALSAPIPGTPVLPSYDPSLMASYDASSMEVTGNVLTKWKNKKGAWGAKGDLVTGNPAYPITVDLGSAVFLGGTNETYMQSQDLDVPMPVGKATFLFRTRMGTPADTVDGTLFSSNSQSRFAFLRRKANGTFASGAGTGERFFTTDTLPNSVWADVAIVFDGAQSKIYIDDKVTTGDPFLNSVQSDMPVFRIGANAAAVQRMIGRFSHIRVYNRAIGFDELKEIRASM